MLAFIQALPLLVRVLSEIWDALKRVSKNNPEAFVAEIANSLEELNNADTDEKKAQAARRIALLWRGPQ